MSSILDRIRGAVVEDEHGCWRYVGYVRPDGYVSMSVAGRRTYGHRAAFEAAQGPIPVGYEVDHICSVRSCLNPAHLRAVPPRVNVLAGTGPTAVNAARQQCVNGHPFTPDNTYRYMHGGSPHRGCRACRADARARYASRKRTR